jgi:hypothetical protein
MKELKIAEKKKHINIVKDPFESSILFIPACVLGLFRGAVYCIPPCRSKKKKKQKPNPKVSTPKTTQKEEAKSEKQRE